MPKSRLAKFSPPRSSKSLVRQRLHARLDAMSAEAAVWVAGAPGAGKTTLASTWAASRGDRLLWFRADEGDGDPGTAFEYFGQLVATVRRGKPVPAYRPQAGARLAPFACSFFRVFYDAIPAASTLVIDDVHAAGGEFATLLAAAIHEAPRDVRLLVLGRTAPSGPLLEELARGSIRLLEPDALAFTANESVELLAERVPAERARELCRRTEGWAAGLLLLGHATDADHGRPTVLAGSVDALLCEQLLAPMDAESIRMLAAASLLPNVDTTALQRLGAGGAERTLEQLRQRHAFVTRLDGQPPSWRMHDLLRDALRSRFESFGNATWAARTRSAAARLAADRHHVRDAVRLHLEAGDGDAAFVLAEARARHLAEARRFDELDAVLAALDLARVEASVPLQLALGESAWLRNDAASAVRALENAYARLAQPEPSADGLLIAATALGAILEGWQDFTGTRGWADRVRRHVSAREAVERPGDRLRIDAVCLRALDMHLEEAVFPSREVLIGRVLDALRSADPSIDADDALAASAVLIETATYQVNDETLFQDVVAATVPWLRKGRASPVAEAGWLITFAPVSRRWPVPHVGLPAATPTACLERAVDLGRRFGARGAQFSAALFLLNLAISESDRAAVQERFRALREATDPEQPTQMSNLLLAEACVLALEGEWRRARATLARAEEIAQRSGFPPSEFWSFDMVRQRIEIASGRCETARASLVELASKQPEGMQRTLAWILADVADAAATIRDRGGATPEQVRSIMEAASANAWPGFATLLAPLAARLCADALRHGIEPEFVRHVIRERRLPAPTPFESHWPWPVRILALGTLRVEVDGVVQSAGPRAQRRPLDLLKVLVAHGPAAVDAAVALDALWPDAEGGAARAAFDMAVMRLRKRLGRDDALIVDAGRIGLDGGTVWVDAWAYAAGAVDDYPGPLFGADTVEPWWAAARERLHQKFLRRVRDRGRSLERAGDGDAAIAVYEAGLAQDPLAEELYQGVIRCHRAAGRDADAMRAYRRCRDQLSIVLGVAPSPATVTLIGSVERR